MMMMMMIITIIIIIILKQSICLYTSLNRYCTRLGRHENIMI